MARKVEIEVPDDVTVLAVNPQKTGRRNESWYTKSYQQVGRHTIGSKFYNQSEMALLYALQHYVEYETSCIKGIRHQYMNTGEMAELMGWKRANLFRVLAGLQKKNAIARAKAQQETYLMNPRLHLAGAKPNPTVMALFRERAEGKRQVRVNRVETWLVLDEGTH